ncbi:DNA primase [Furfurilactobacillus siliginis]|uniref:DNA primase n=1 Tax=Furfurilactobacillus siliginis TaxID=348151 RepID=A0A0R2LER0_9LACO|nr:DNA primase [Furfurilactobacillus siliginis]KRN97037.1 dna primase dnag [Furfurilactobacillus siliginis]GEK27798.1 DNA primase [Furfurilactobacillus siliginis]
MATRIPEEIIESVRTSVNIADVVGQYVQLKKSGRNLFGLCPFHEEKTASFSVNEEKQIFHCFSCGRGGNVFKFLMELNDVSFPEAVIQVADDANITIPDTYKQVDQPNVDSDFARLIGLHENAAKLYHHVLMNTQVGEAALTYLHDRGLDDETIATFNIGFAPGDGLLKPLFEERKVDYQLLRSSGLFIESQDGQLRDRFTNRIMFTIRNASGKVIAFSGRILHKDPDSPKYLNSPETKIFHKSDTLFNFDLARKEIRKENAVVLFEGFMDVIAAYSAGVKNGIASMGTSLTTDQIGILQRVAETLYVSYDGDDAGQNATHRALSLIGEHSNMSLGVIQMPEGLDPDEYLRKYDAEHFRAVYEGAKETPVGFALRYLARGRNLNNQSEQLSYIEEVLKIVAGVPSPVEQDLYLNQLADRFQIDKASLKEQLSGLRQSKKTTVVPGEQQTGQMAPPLKQVEQEQPHFDRVERAERLLLHRMITDQNVWLHVTANQDFHFVHEHYQTLFFLAQGYKQTHPELQIAGFLDYVNDDDLQRQLINLTEQPVVSRDDMSDVDDCMHIIMNQAPVDETIRQKNLEMIEAKRLNNRDLQNQLTLELVALYKQKQDMRRA